MTKGKHSASRFQLLTWVAGLTTFLLVVGVGGAAATVRTDPGGAVKLNGFQVGGVDLAGLDAKAALRKLNDKFEAPLDDPISVKLNGRSVGTTTRRELGASTDVEKVYRRALQLHEQMPVLKRLWYRITGMSVGHKLEVKTRFGGDKVQEFVAGIAAQVNEAPVDASVSAVGSSFRIVDGAPGFALDEAAAAAALKEAAGGEIQSVEFTGAQLMPAVTKESFKSVIVVKVGENKLYHYKGEQLVKSYDVATGLPNYPTPTGQFKITQMRFRPTWVNPATKPGQWGAKLPARIGPGPGNPLGTRAMNLNSPNIRIHGTSNNASLGYNASHGCIRMRMADVEELYEQVGVGTPVIIQSAGPARLMPARPATPTIEDLVESNGAAAAAAPPPEPAPVPVPVPVPEPEPAPETPPVGVNPPLGVPAGIGPEAGTFPG